MTQVGGTGVEVVVGGSLEEDLAEAAAVWERAARGEAVAPRRVLAFESWETLAAVMTGERYRLMRHLHAHPAPSVNALAAALGRQYRRVHADVVALQDAGLIERVPGAVRTTTDVVQAEIRF